MQGGRIEVHSDGEGCGSEFVIHLPVDDRQSVVSPGATLDQLDNTGSVCTRVLVVDDNRDAAVSLAMLLRALGNEVQTANDGITALEAIRSFQPSLVLLDLGMPGMSGYEVAERARAMPEAKGATLVALTGWGQADDRQRTKDAGFDQHLVKPVELQTLQALLSQVQSQKMAASVRQPSVVV
jgi:CheY-like chemotaxis protein